MWRNAITCAYIWGVRDRSRGLNSNMFLCRGNCFARLRKNSLPVSVVLSYGKTWEFRPHNHSENYITHLPSTNEVKWISDKKDLNTSSFKHLFNALLMSLHSPRNFPTGCCKERRKKICIQHKNMAKQARVYSTTRLTTNLFVTAMQLLYNF